MTEPMTAAFSPSGCACMAERMESASSAATAEMEEEDELLGAVEEDDQINEDSELDDAA